jgi:spore coat protein CotH
VGIPGNKLRTSAFGWYGERKVVVRWVCLCVRGPGSRRGGGVARLAPERMSSRLDRYAFAWLGLLGVSCVLASGGPGLADESDAFFDDTFVHEIRIYFDDPNWYNVLYASHDTDPDDPYFPARFEYGATVLDPVGVRFKGNSSFGIPGVKKSFKIDFDEYFEDDPAWRFLGLKKLNLNNGFKDPTMLRAKLFLDFAGQYVPSIRAVHTRLYVNDVYWGLYLAVDQIDKTFCQSQFGADEDGNLFKAAASDDLSDPQSDFGSDLTWLGSDPVAYHEHYQLKTNEADDDYSQLIAFIDVLNNTATAQLPAALEPVFDVDNALWALALNNLFVNLDSYHSAAHNYYLHDRDDTGRITHVHWDTNEAFGRFLMGVEPGDDPLEMDPFWLPVGMGPPPQPTQPRPLMENLWAVDSYNKTYLRDLAWMLREGFDVSTMEARINELADIIRTDVYADTNKQYTDAQFETNLYNNIYLGGPGGTIYGLRFFVQQRAAYLDPVLDTYAQLKDLRLNELMSVNVGTIQDGAGDYDPWVEIYNLGPGLVNLSGLYLTDDDGNPTKLGVAGRHSR